MTVTVGAVTPGPAVTAGLSVYRDIAVTMTAVNCSTINFKFA